VRFCMLIWFSSTAYYPYGGLGFGHHRHERLNQPSEKQYMHAYYFSSMHNLVLHFKVKLSRFNSKQSMFFNFVPEVGNALTCVIVLWRELCAGVNNGMPISKCKNFVHLYPSIHTDFSNQPKLSKVPTLRTHYGKSSRTT
jgi:hypothetical protein